MARKVYTKEFLEEIVKKCDNWGDVVREIGISVHGGNRDYIKKQCIKEGVDFSHFNGRHWIKGRKRTGYSPNKLTPEEVLIFRENPKYRQHAYILRNALIATGVEYKCSECGISDIWNDKPIRIEVDHIDGDHRNCTRENLRFLCPNCHSQTKNYKTNGRKFSAESHNGSAAFLKNAEGR